MGKNDCLDCGHCESCIDRSIAAAELTDNQQIEAAELASRGIVWLSPALPKETGRDAAKRFVLETFDAERSIRFEDDGRSRFADGYWCYRIELGGDKWVVTRLNELTPKAKARMRARDAKGK